MHAEVKIFPSHEGLTNIMLSIPTERAQAIFEAINGILPLAGLTVQQYNEEDEEVVPFNDVFPDTSPAMTLRGFRGKMEWTQHELATQLHTTQNCISEMESGKRPISKAMALRLSDIFDIPYKVFL